MFTRDLLERVVRSFVAAAASAWLVTGEFSQTAGLAAVTAGFTAVVCLIAKQFGDPESASFRK